MSLPVFHLSLPVRDLDEAVGFYTSKLCGVLGRRAAGWADVALFGAQVTLHHSPADVSVPMPRTRHFGATLPWDRWVSLTATFSEFIEPPRIDHRDTEFEQAKAMITDPSGNLIELKAYKNPRAVLGEPAS